MKRGLVIGKFMPLHFGHIELIQYAKNFCDEVVVLVCVEDNEPIGDIRFDWVSNYFKNRYDNKIKPILFKFNEKDLSTSSVASQDISKAWSEAILKLNLGIDIIISSEEYGEYVAKYMNIEYQNYDIGRTKLNISATMIRENPYKYWYDMPREVQPYFYKKICIIGTESTGKTILAKKLADYFGGYYVGEMGRELTTSTYDCTYENLINIAHEHAKLIKISDDFKKKILIVDTDITITKSYSKFLFNKELLGYQKWVDDINKFDLYIYLDNDVPYVQDGTRLSETDRNKLDEYHKAEFEAANIKYELISGNWNERFDKAIKLILKT